MINDNDLTEITTEECQEVAETAARAIVLLAGYTDQLGGEKQLRKLLACLQEIVENADDQLNSYPNGADGEDELFVAIDLVQEITEAINEMR